MKILNFWWVIPLMILSGSRNISPEIILQNTRLGITTLELLLNYGVSAYSKDSAPFRHWHLNNSKGGKR